MFKAVVKLHDGTVVEAFRDRYEDAVTFKVKTLQWGIKYGSKYYTSQQVEKVLVEEASDPTGGVKKPKSSTRKRPARKSAKGDPADV